MGVVIDCWNWWASVKVLLNSMEERQYLIDGMVVDKGSPSKHWQCFWGICLKNIPTGWNTAVKDCRHCCRFNYLLFSGLAHPKLKFQTFHTHTNVNGDSGDIFWSTTPFLSSTEITNSIQCESTVVKDSSIDKQQTKKTKQKMPPHCLGGVKKVSRRHRSPTCLKLTPIMTPSF